MGHCSGVVHLFPHSEHWAIYGVKHVQEEMFRDWSCPVPILEGQRAEMAEAATPWRILLSTTRYRLESDEPALWKYTQPAAAFSADPGSWAQ